MRNGWRAARAGSGKGGPSLGHLDAPREVESCADLAEVLSIVVSDLCPSCWWIASTGTLLTFTLDDPEALKLADREGEERAA